MSVANRAPVRVEDLHPARTRIGEDQVFGDGHIAKHPPYGDRWTAQDAGGPYRGQRAGDHLGSVSNPATVDLLACYVLLDADESGYEARFRRVAYDRAAAIAAVERTGHPEARHILRYLRGENQSRWADQAAG
jgi:hypothetical protein